MQKFKESGYSSNFRSVAWKLWLKVGGSPDIYSPYLFVLADIAWIERVKNKFEKQKIIHPAIPKTVWLETIKPIINKSCKIVFESNQISVIAKDGRIAASCRIPVIDERLLCLLSRGLKSLGSLTGHRLIRWEIKSGCKNFINGAPDPRHILMYGGYEGIAKAIGCGKDKSQVTDVKAMLHAQQRCDFRFPDGTARGLISLKEIGFHRNKEPNKIEIILGPDLFPHSIFQFAKHGGLLIPIADLPPLIGSTQTYAAQAMLQLLILEEFSKQSDRLFREGSVIISMEQWEKLSQEAQLPPSQIGKVVDAWSENGAFLQKDGDEFSLQDAEIEGFLKEQGKRRISGQKGGKESVRKRATIGNKDKKSKGRKVPLAKGRKPLLLKGR